MSTGEEPWALPPRRIRLEQGSLHVWRASLDMPATGLEGIAGLLSANEREQCARFLRPRDRAQCVVARASLRIVLAKYIHEEPRALSITIGASGKPSLASSTGIQFNISHAGDLTLIAVSLKMRVGIDLERIREVRDMDAIVHGFFGGQEQAYLRACEGDGGERTRAFFLLWTRREAAAKARGLGLFESFARDTLPAFDYNRGGFRVELAPRGAPRGGSERWWIRDLVPAAGYAGALCVEQENAEPSFWRL